MMYFGIEIYDGKPLKPILLNETLPLEEQWFYLTQDIACIDYIIKDSLVFSLDVGWYPNTSVTPDSFFKTEIMEGPYTEGEIFFERYSTTIVQLKKDIIEAVALIQSFKQMEIEDIIRKKIS
jgi:hypothetical protein